MPVKSALQDESTLGDLIDAGTAELQTGPFGTMLHASSYIHNGVPVVAVKNISDNRIDSSDIPQISSDDAKRLKQYALKEGDILFSRKGAVERRALVRAEEQGWLQGSDCIRLRFNGSIEPRFVSYVLGTREMRRWLTQHAHGATMPSLNQSILRMLPLRLPPLPEQKKIARCLGQFDDKIELNRRMSQTLEEIARALFKSWFVDFDPVHAKAAGREPVGMDAETAALFPSEFEESELGLIPKGWRVRRIDSVASVAIGRTPPRKEPQWFSKNVSDLPWVSIKDLGNAHVFISHSSEFLTTGAVSRFRMRQIPAGVVLLSFKLTIGRVAITDRAMYSNEAIANFIPNEKNALSSQYLYLWLKDFNYANLGSTSSIATAINSDIVRSIPILIPAAAVNAAFSETISVVFSRIRQCNHEADTLTSIRDTLLPAMLAGEISPALREPKG